MSKPVIVFLDRDTTDVGDIDLSGIENLGDLQSFPVTSASETADRISGAEIVLTNKVVVRGPEMDSAPNLKLIQVVATGTNNVDIEAARERGIAVCNVSGYSTPSVAQHVFACLLNLVTNVHRFAEEPEKWAKSPHFTRLDFPVTELAGKRLGIAGLGTIGGEVAGIGRAFGMEVVALAREGSGGTGSDGVHRLEKEEFFSSCDVITLHCPLTPETHFLINSGTLALMKPTSILINTGRGDLVNEGDLLEALRSGTIAAAAVDVVSQEPPPADHPMMVDPPSNLMITPHTAWSSREARQRLVDGVAENIRTFLEGGELNRVDK